MEAMDAALNFAQTMLRLGGASTATFSREAVAEAADKAVATLVSLGVEPPNRERLIAELEQRYSVSIGSEVVLLGDEAHEIWYKGDRAKLGPFGERYFRYLREIRNWSPAAVASLEHTTERIVSLIGDPQRKEHWDRRGLVVGHVQSGKTANYAGVVTRAADAGYRLFVVLTGMHNALRAQTQMRLDEDFVGFESSPTMARGKPIGVSTFDKRPMVYCLTHRDMDGDFNRARAETALQSVPDDPVLLVLKKNVSVLKNVNAWVEDVLRERGVTKRVPLLIIDDEADQASIDTRQQDKNEFGDFDEDYDPTRINAQIRRLLQSFDRSSYVAYTATPFANILIHDQAVAKDYGEDLFPRSFIVNLPAPSDYVGPALLFGSEDEDALPLTRDVDQSGEQWVEEKHKSDFVPRFKGEEVIPPSLRRAVLTFVLACAARSARGQGERHNSMLVHVSRFKQVQERVHGQVQRWFKSVSEKLTLGIGDEGILEELRSLWATDLSVTSRKIRGRAQWSGLPEHTWDEIRPLIVDVIRRIEVRLVNSDIKQPLDYDRYPHGLNVIAVGGDKLSRGLTLEGLTVSYFLRASRMYDSLMQMGRWFGYRPGYLDMCRIFMPNSLREWFKHVALAGEDLRRQLDHMASLGATPKQYGLGVQVHEVMMVTARNKSRHGQDFDVSFAGDIKIPTLMSTLPEDVQANHDRTLAFLASIGAPGGDGAPDDEDQSSRMMWLNVEGQKVQEFIRGFRFHKEALQVTSVHLAEYISAQLGAGELGRWTVVLANGKGPEQFAVGHERAIKLVTRTPEEDTRPFTYKVKTVLSPGDEALDLSDVERQRAMALSVRARESNNKPPPKRPDGFDIRTVRPANRGLLIIYPLKPPPGAPSSLPIFAPVISFPRSPSARPISVKANSVFIREFVL